ncbi:hypothetical protein JCM5350_007601 [Sporobolomyces pararoseus]
MTTTTISDPTQTLQSNNPFRNRSLTTAGNSFAPNDIVSDLEASEDTTTEEEQDEEVEPDQPRRPGMYDRQRSLSGNSTSSSKQFKLRRKPPPPPPRPIFPPAQDEPAPSKYAPPPGRPSRESLREKGNGTGMTDLEKQEKILLQRAIEESKRESSRRETINSDEDDQLRKALEASRREDRARTTPPISSEESEQIQRALALSSAEQEFRLPRSSNTPSPTKPVQSTSSNATPTTPSRVRSESGPEALPPFPFTEEDLVRPSYPKEKSHLFPQGLPSLPPGAGTTQDEYEREMEMLTLAIRMSEEEERLRQEREERELREVVRRVEEKENAALSSTSKPSIAPRRTSPPSSAESANGETISPPTSPKTKRSWFRPPLASKYSTATSPPASPPLSPESTIRPSLEATPTDSTTRSNATSFQSAAESLPFTNLISTTAVPNDLSSRIESSKPQRRPPAPPHPTRLPPSPPETPIVQTTTSFAAPPIPPLPAPYARSRQNTNESDRGGPFLPAHSEAFRNENAGSPIEMPYLTPSASNSIRSMHRGENGRLNSWALDERNGSGGSGSGGSRSESTSGHSRVNSTNRRSIEVVGASGVTPQNRSEDGEGSAGRRSFEEGDDFRDEDQASIESQVQLAIRNPDSSPAPPLELQHQGGFVNEPPAVDVPRDVEAGDPYLEGLDGPVFESAYAGRSMSAIDEQTEPASSIIAEDGFSRQGSYPSTDGGSLDPTIHRGETERVLEGLPAQGAGGEEMRSSITYHPRPIDEREWMHESVLRRPSHPPLSDSLLPTPPRRGSPPESNEYPQLHARQTTASSTAITESSAGPRLSFPLPPFSSTLPPTSASPVESSLTSSTVPTTRPETSGELQSSEPATASSTSFADGTRFGHPSICAREPGHVCPHDGLSSQQEVPESIELTALLDEREPPSVGQRLHRHSTRRREETGGKSILRDAWTVEARNWGSLLRFLMWYGDTRIIASPQDIALEPSRHCTAAASLEFRPDDEGYTIIRLVVTILPPDDPDSHSHRELTVEHPTTTPPAHHGKGKGKSRSYFHSSSSAPNPDSSSLSSLATFHLPDSVHLPCRLSNLAIQLYTLRHLASIARSTQPAKEGGTASYQALRELSISLDNLTSIAQSRLERDASSHQGPSHYRAQSGGGGGGEMNRSDENERLLTRLRDRLRRLKRGGGGGANENSYPNTSPTKPNKLVKAPPTRKETNPQSRDNFAALTQTVQPLPRTERVLSANDHEHDEEEEENEVGEIGSGSGNHLEVDGARWSMVRRDQGPTRRDRIPEEWENRRNVHVGNETSYMPILRS